MGRHLTNRDLDEQSSGFVRDYITTGNGEAAAISNGYGEWTARNWRTALLPRAHIAYAIAIAMRRRIAEHAPMALRTLAHLAEKAESEKVRHAAAKDILALSGFVAPRGASEKPKEEKALHEQSTNELQELAARLESELAGRAKTVSGAQDAPQESQAIDLVG